MYQIGSTRLLLAIILLLPLGGCSSLLGGGTPPTRFFILSPLSQAQPKLTASREIRVVVEPVTIPPYLDRPQIISRTGSNELEIAEFNQWGEDLRTHLSRMVVTNLSQAFPSGRVQLLPSRGLFNPHYRLRVDIIQFEVDADGRPVLFAHWSLRGPKDEDKLYFRENTNLTGGVVSLKDYSARTRGLSQLLADFCRTIAERIQRQEVQEMKKPKEENLQEGEEPKAAPLPEPVPKTKPSATLI